MKRFADASAGDGTWPPLAESTIAGRRKGSSAILRDTGTIFASLTPVWDNPPGTVNALIEDGVSVNIGGEGAHPSGLLTIAELMQFHQDGGPNLPKREIIVEPPQSVIDACVSDLQKGLEQSTKTTS
jgi:hypothetical protein